MTFAWGFVGGTIFALLLATAGMALAQFFDPNKANSPYDTYRQMEQQGINQQQQRFLNEQRSQSQPNFMAPGRNPC